ncbi:MAG TPA: hypothetical protein VLE43_04240 [Candidatus Saccharimonadia bacterium]|nr:hypothetical protein [Candidatus Saccharimonadia bacterium]
MRIAALTALLILQLSLVGVCRVAAADTTGAAAPATSQISTEHRGPACGAVDTSFLNEVWAKVGAQSCLKCHKAGGDAEDSEFILQDPSRDTSAERHVSTQHNWAAFQRMALSREGEGKEESKSKSKDNNESRLLLKAIGGLDHGGEDVLKPGTPRHQVLVRFVRSMEAAQAGRPNQPPAIAAASDAPPFFEGIEMMDNRRLLRRLTLSLAARLPTPQEMAAVEKQGLKALDPILDAVMKEEAFYDRLAEAFNDIFLVRGYDNGAESALSYEHFSTTRHWTQKHDLTKYGDEKAQTKARYKLADDYREALIREPLELVKYIVRHDHPFTEIVTADYVMMSPYTSRGYGMYEELKDKFKNTEDPYEYIPVRLHSLKNRTGRDHQQSETGYYPHAGMLSIFQYLRRYPTTETNRNRLRARMYYEHFLGIDVLELAARVADAAAVTAKYEIPTMQASECVVCHKTIDPVAGLFQDYYSFEGVFGPRKDGWFKDIFPAGFEGEDMPAEQRWRSLQWLAEHTVKDPRFATTMVEHVYRTLTGRKVLLPPKALDDPLFDAKLRAYRAQRREVEQIATVLTKANFNLKAAFKAWAVSPFYRADGVATGKLNTQRQAELADIGLARVLTPEQVERKIAAIFGKSWGRLQDKQYSILYGGIDSKEVTERATDPSGAMGAIQRTMANDIACKNVALDFSKPAEQRKLFPKVEPDVLPGASAEKDKQIREAIMHLHQVVLGRYDTIDSPEVTRSFELFSGIISDAQARKGLEPLENYSCRAEGEARLKDPLYTVRAWRGVVTYLLRQSDFLYE